jgi:hypothetical protein
MINEIFENCKQIGEKEEPYTGSTGPSEEQVRKNNRSLKQALAKDGIKAKLIKTTLGGALDDPIEVLEVAPGITIGYDRWGFVGEVAKGKVKGKILDQGDQVAAIAWVKRNIEKE